MIHPDEAGRLIECLDCRLAVERISLASALGRVPAEAPLARLEQPTFDKATMDGFAYGTADGAMAEIGASFVLVDVIAAGSPPPAPLEAGQCVRIMTGAPVPAGAAAVHRLERSEQADGRVVLAAREEGLNIVRRGANRRSGDPLFPRRPLRPQDLALLASDGVSELEAVAKPRALVLSTGCELRSSGETLAPGSIYDTNGPLLVALAAAAGCEAAFAGIVPDDGGALRDAIVEASGRSDLLLLSGGVSAGDFDFVPEALERSGFELLFRRMAIRPGMPVLLARRFEGGRARFACGMPGNPVSAFVGFELVAKPLIWRLSGLRYEPRFARVRAGGPIERAATDRVELVPVELREGLALPLRYTGSTMLDVLSRAEAFVRLEIGQSEIPEGAECLARLV